MLRKRISRRVAVRQSRFVRMANGVQWESLEQRIMLTASASPDTLQVPTPILPTAPTPLQGVVSTPNSLGPQALVDSYDIDNIFFDVNGTVTAGDGAGQTIAIVDAYGSPTIVNDAVTFDQHWGLSNTDSNGKFFLTVQALQPTVNTVQLPATVQAGWAEEASLDVEWAHAVAPAAHILLVEAPSPTLLDMLDANVYAAAQTGVVTVSNSWGIDNADVDNPNEPAIYDGYLVTPDGHTDSDGLTNAGVTFFAASGDVGGSINFPATSNNVIPVGGQTWSTDINFGQQNLGAWSGSGGGTDPNYTDKYQEPYVAMDADPQTGVWVYDSTANQFGSSGWQVVGGTSLASPLWAGYFSIIDEGLELQGIPSLDTDQAIEGGYQYNNSLFDGAGGDPDLQGGLLWLAELGIGQTSQEPLYPNWPDTTDEDFFGLGQHVQQNDFPLFSHATNSPVPNAPLENFVPSNGNTGFGAPNGEPLARDMVGGPVGGSNITVIGTGLDYLQFATAPTGTEANSTLLPIVVDVEQPLGAGIDTTYNGAVTIDFDPVSTPGGTLQGTTTVQAVNGVATFTGLTIKQIGTYEFDVSAPNTIGAFSPSIVIAPAAADHLAFLEQPGSTWQFSTIPDFEVEVEDQYGNLVTSDASNITVKEASGPAAVLSGATTVAAIGGIATFSGLTLNEGGTYTFVATDGSLTSATSNAFAVVPIPVTTRYLFNGIGLSSGDLHLQQIRNAAIYDKTAPTAAQVKQVDGANNNESLLSSGEIVTGSYAAAPISPAVVPGGSPFAASGSAGH